MLHFATYFDINYLSRGLALLSSLGEHTTSPFRLYVLALDQGVVEYFDQLKDEQVITITLADLERAFPELAGAKNNRSTIEYYFTLSPYLPLYILNTYPNIAQVTTMDADIYFFDDPNKILAAYSNASVLITPHNFSSNLEHFIVYGKYNVSFQSFKNDTNGRLCLEDWRQKCLEWCYDEYDAVNGRFADQKYLDSWTEKFPGVEDITIPGTGLAPWNIEKHHYHISNNQILVNDMPLIYYHFHHLRVFNKSFAFSGLEKYAVLYNRPAVKLIYHTYLKKLSSFANIQQNQDKYIIRNNDSSNNRLGSKLKHPEGYWFFTDKTIIHLNPARWRQQLKKKLFGAWRTS